MNNMASLHTCTCTMEVEIDFTLTDTDKYLINLRYKLGLCVWVGMVSLCGPLARLIISTQCVHKIFHPCCCTKLLVKIIHGLLNLSWFVLMPTSSSLQYKQMVSSLFTITLYLRTCRKNIPSCMYCTCSLDTVFVLNPWTSLLKTPLIYFKCFSITSTEWNNEQPSVYAEHALHIHCYLLWRRQF